MWWGMLKGRWYIPLLLKPRQDPVGAFGIQGRALSSYTVCMKNFVVQSGEFITTSGIYRMNDHPSREITLIYAMLCRRSREGRSRFGSSALPKIPGGANAEGKGLTKEHFLAEHVRTLRKQTSERRRLGLVL
jgi:hypothetical protein